MSYDSDERMCYECLYAEDEITVKDILDASAYEWNRDREQKITKQHIKKKEKP